MANAHMKGMYGTKAEAEQRARELGCTGTHRIDNLWMPCANESRLHQQLNKQ